MDVSGVRVDMDLPCFLPRPIKFSVEYNESNTLTLSWATSRLPENSTIRTCIGGEVYEVQAKWYASYEDYRSIYRIRGVVDFQTAGGVNYTEYELDVSRIARGSYFIFCLVNGGQAIQGSPRMEQTTLSPVFQFERQGL